MRGYSFFFARSLEAYWGRKGGGGGGGQVRNYPCLCEKSQEIKLSVHWLQFPWLLVLFSVRTWTSSVYFPVLSLFVVIFCEAEGVIVGRGEFLFPPSFWKSCPSHSPTSFFFLELTALAYVTSRMFMKHL